MVRQKDSLLPIGILLYSAIILLWFLRAWFSVEITDEAYTVASVFSASNGAIPLADSWDPHLGWFIFVPIYKLFEIFSEDLSGIILFFRGAYCLFALTMSAVTGLLIYRKEKAYTVFFISLTSIIIVPFSLYQINYNNFVALGLMVIAAITYSYESIRIKKIYIGIILGIIFSLICLIYPTMIFAAGLYFLFVYIYKKENKIAISYAMTGIIIAFLFLAWMYCYSGLEQMKYGLEQILSSPKEVSKNITDIRWIYNSVCIAIKRVFNHKTMLLFAGMIFLLYLSTLFTRSKFIKIALPFIYIIFCTNIQSSNVYALYFILICFCYIIFNKIKIGEEKIFLLVWLFFCLTYHFSSDNSNIVISLEASANLLYFSALFILYKNLKNKRSYFLIISIISVTLLAYNYKYVYRDADIRELDHKVEYGIYKGLYTTKNRKEAVEKIQKLVEDTIPEGATVCTVTRMPYIYLMCKGKVFAPYAWEAQYLNRGFTSAEPLLNWFSLHGDLPQYIVCSTNEIKDFFENKKYEINILISEQYKLLIKDNTTDIPIYIYERNNR